MKRPAYIAAVAATLVATILASCSSDNSKTLAPVDQPSTDNPTTGASAMSGGGWSPVVEAASQSSNKVTVCHSGNGKNYTQITVSVQGAAAHLGESKNGKGGHANDYRVSENTTCPPPATPSNLQVCKVAGPGVINTANFTFVLTANGETKTITVPAGAAPNGNCVSGGDYRVGTTVSIHENAQQGISTTAIAVSPTGAQQGTSDLPGGNASVIIGTGTTTVTYTNQGPTGSLVICKVAGTGVTAGTNFTFTIPGQSATVAAGAAPNGTCAAPLTVGAGNVTVTEAQTTGVSVTNVTATNGGANVLVSSDLTARTATATITAGQTTTVTYTNSAATANGTLIICKVAGTGVTVGANFGFTVGTTQTLVPAGAAPNGTCSTAIMLPPGPATVTEAAVSNTSVQSISGTPVAPTNINLASRSATVQINAGQETRITFTNVSP
jgi:hypothetical protein